MPHDLEVYKQNAIVFYHAAYHDEPARAFETYVRAEYILHMPLVENGEQTFIDSFEEMARDYPDKLTAFTRVAAESDLVALHTHQTWPGGDEYVSMARPSSTGMLSERFRRKPRTGIRCIETLRW